MEFHTCHTLKHVTFILMIQNSISSRTPYNYHCRLIRHTCHRCNRHTDYGYNRHTGYGHVGYTSYGHKGQTDYGHKRHTGYIYIKEKQIMDMK